jgi:hypothetical protein
MWLEILVKLVGVVEILEVLILPELEYTGWKLALAQKLERK